MTHTHPIRRAAIVGGTHGNEWTGVYLAKKYQQYPHLVERSSFKTQVLLGNPKAIAQSKRYIDKDLNRCFNRIDLEKSDASTYEDQQARRLAQELEQVDAIVDLHTTTANMGATLILRDRHPLLLQLAAYLTAQHPDLKVCCSALSQGSGYLSGLRELGMTLEMGAIAQSTLDAALFQTTEKIVASILDGFEALNQGQLQASNSPLTLYQYIGSLDYPRTEQGELRAMIHPKRQNRDYEPMHPGDPIFLTFTGETIPHTSNEIVYPIFINEAAYYEKGMAMGLTEKQQITFGSY